MSEFTFTGRGKLSRIDRFTSKGGKEILTLIFEQGGPYPQTIPIKVFGVLASMVGDWPIGRELDVTGRLGGREYNGKVYGDMVATMVEVAAEAAATSEPPPRGDDDVAF